MENKTEESIIVTIDDTEGNSRDFVQDMVIPFDGKGVCRSGIDS